MQTVTYPPSLRPEVVIRDNHLNDANNFVKSLRKATEESKSNVLFQHVWGPYLARLSKLAKRIRRSSVWNPFKPLSHSIASIESSFGSGVASFYSFYATVIYINLLLIFIYGSLVVWAWLVFPPKPYSEVVSTWEWGGVFGVDGLEDSFMYYGGYAATKQGPWNMPLAYTWAILLSIVGSLAIAIYKISEGGRFDTSKSVEQVVFSMWDHSLTEDSAVKEMRKALYAALKEIQLSKISRKDEQSLGFWKESLLILSRSTGIVLSTIVIMIGFGGILIVSLFQDFFSGIFFLLPSVIITGINSSFPVILRWLVVLEQWNDPVVVERNQLGRVYLLKMANLFFVLLGIANSEVTYNADGEPICSETHAGRLFWQMLLIDSFIAPLIVTGTGWAFRIIKGKGEFTISPNVINVLYRQAIIQVGSMTCPVMPILGTLANLVLFLVMAGWMRSFYHFPSKPMSSSKSSGFLNSALFVHSIVVIMPIIYFLNRQTSGLCGPHRNEKPLNQLEQMFNAFPDEVQVVFGWITHPLVLTSVLLVLLILFFIYIKRSRNSTNAHKHIINNLKKTVNLQRRATLNRNDDTDLFFEGIRTAGVSSPPRDTKNIQSPLLVSRSARQESKKTKSGGQDNWSDDSGHVVSVSYDRAQHGGWLDRN